MNNKLQIENAILGAVVFCEGFPKIAHILSASNFTSNEHTKNRELFQVISSLYPTRPIDLITVSHEIKVLHQDHEQITGCLFSLNNYVQASSNIVYWSFILLQLDIADKYKAHLIQWKDYRDRDQEHVESAALREIIENINPQSDIFEIIESSIKYFAHINMAFEHEEAEQFYRDIAQKARKVKRMDSIMVAIRNLYTITNCNNQVISECEKFAAAIADMITTGTTNPRYTEAVNIIHR